MLFEQLENIQLRYLPSEILCAQLLFEKPDPAVEKGLLATIQDQEP